MVSTILVLLNTGIFVNRDGILFYLEPFVRVCFRVVWVAISQCCTFSLESAAMKCPVPAGSALDRRQLTLLKDNFHMVWHRKDGKAHFP